MPQSGNDYSKGYNSFSGVDIKGVFGNQVIAELQAISYSITREKAPLYTMGSADPRSFSRGKRGIAGTLIFLIFDRHALISAFGQDAPEQNQLRFLSDIDDVRPAARGPAGEDGSLANALTVGTDSVAGSPTGTPLFGGVTQQETNLTSISSDQEVVGAWFADQLPPFDITLAAANEYGSLAVMRVFGCEILNEGYGVSIDDIVSEQQMTYVARTLTPWRPVANTDIASQLNATGASSPTTG